MTDLPGRGGLPPRALLLMVAVCVIWAGNAVLLRFAVGIHALPPIHVAAGRFLIVAILLLPLLWRPVEKLRRVVLAGLLMGAGHFGFLMVGYAHITATASAVLLQVGIPVTAILSMSLGIERPSKRRLGLVVAATAAVILALWQPGQIDPRGAICILASALCLAVGGVILAGSGKAGALTIQAWTALCSAIALCALAAVVEPGAATALMAQPWLSAGSIVVPALIVTVGAHTVYYHLLRTYRPSLVAATSMLFPALTILFGVAFLGEPLSLQFVLGSAVALVLLIALGRERSQEL